MTRPGMLWILLGSKNCENVFKILIATHSESSTVIEVDRPDAEQQRVEAEEAQEHITQLQPIKPGGTGVKKRTGSMTTLRRASTASFRGPRGKLRDEEDPNKNKQNKEFSEQGKVKWSGTRSHMISFIFVADVTSLCRVRKDQQSRCSLFLRTDVGWQSICSNW
jgi:hypothetical protein